MLTLLGNRKINTSMDMPDCTKISDGYMATKNAISRSDKQVSYLVPVEFQDLDEGEQSVLVSSSSGKRPVQ
jgi:hypothetical protein